VAAGAKFCAECGTPMAKHCTNCNASLVATAKFCAECGTPASPPVS
jgi:Double zinc ribbon